MKNSTLIIVLFLISFGTYAQESGVKKYEIGINLYSITEYAPGRSFWYTDPFHQTLNHQFLSGIAFKRNWEKQALRISIDYTYKFKEYEEPELLSIQDSYQESRSFLRIENRVGYEHQFLTFGKFKPYIAVDLITGIESFKYEYTGYDYSNKPIQYSDQYNYLRIGLAPVLGINYQISKGFSASIETSLGVIGTFLIKDNTMSSPDGDFTFKPIRILSVNYHF